jgi:type I secretion membrane fusion protein, HlyD family
MTKPDRSMAEREIRRYLAIGLAVCLLLVGVGGGIAATQKISGAVVAFGTLVVDSSIKRIQHPTGGIVAQINVREGDGVEQGDLLVRLDDTTTRANLAIVATMLDQLGAQAARLVAERDDKAEIIFPESLMERQAEPEIARLLEAERSLFSFRNEVRVGRKAQLRQRIEQLSEQIAGLQEQKNAKEQETRLVRLELEGVRELWRQKLTSLERVTALERDAVRIDGEHGQLVSSIAQARGGIAEIELQIIQIDQDARSGAAESVRDIEIRMAELAQRKIAAEDALNHIELRSPTKGIVHELTVHTIGGVIGAGETIMQIVPTADKLTIDARISPNDIDQLVPGQPVTIILSAFNRQTTPTIAGRLAYVSRDLVTDERAGLSFYKARVDFTSEDLAALEGVDLQAGMPAELFFPTTERTILSYLVKPLADQLKRSFRQD